MFKIEKCMNQKLINGEKHIELNQCRCDMCRNKKGTDYACKLDDKIIVLHLCEECLDKIKDGKGKNFSIRTTEGVFKFNFNI